MAKSNNKVNPNIKKHLKQNEEMSDRANKNNNESESGFHKAMEMSRKVRINILKDGITGINEPLDSFSNSERGVESSSNSIIKSKKKEKLKNYPLPAGFSQIDCSATKEEILSFFLILTKEKNNRNNEPFMISEDVTELVENNFKVFGESSTGRVFDINLLYRQKSTFTTFVYRFYEKYAAFDGYKKKDYANFLIWNFTNYKNDKRSSLESNMTPSKAPKRKNLIQIKSDLED